MEPLDYWKLNKYFSIIEAALLILGLDPSKYDDEIDSWHTSNLPDGYVAIRSALISAIETSDLKAKVVYIKRNDTAYSSQPIQEINPYLTKIKKDDIKNFLKDKPIHSSFFQSEDNQYITPLNQSGEFYSPKLAAALEAWKVVTSEKHRLNKCTPKQALEKWLEENALNFGLINKDGSINKNGIEEIAKVANWKAKGGAPQLTSQYPEPIIKEDKLSFDDQFDDDEDIPF